MHFALQAQRIGSTPTHSRITMGGCQGLCLLCLLTHNVHVCAADPATAVPAALTAAVGRSGCSSYVGFGAAGAGGGGQ